MIRRVLAAYAALIRPPQATRRAAGPNPGAGEGLPPTDVHGSPGVHAPALGHDHGGHHAAIDIWADGRTITRYTTSGIREERPGECWECAGAEGTCHLCGLYPRTGVVYEYLRCPAHTEPEPAS